MKKLFLLICPLRYRGKVLRALEDMSAKNVSFFGRLPLFDLIKNYFPSIKYVDTVKVITQFFDTHIIYENWAFTLRKAKCIG